MVFCPSLSCLSLFFSPPWSSFSSRVFAFWQSSKRLNCCSTRYHIVLRNLSFSSPFSKTFLLPFYRVSGPAVCRECIDHVPRFRTNCSAELSKRLRVFSFDFVPRCFPRVIDWRVKFGRKMQRIKIERSSMMVEILLKWRLFLIKIIESLKYWYSTIIYL